MRQFAPAVAAVVLGGVFLAACGGGTNPPSVTRSCVSDPASEGQACRSDEQCGCGTGCVLGLCAATCRADSDCGDGRCDEFGRCRASKTDLSLARPLAPALEGKLLVTPSSLQVTPLARDRQISVRAEQALLPVVRIAATAGLQVRCDPAASFASECQLSSLAPGAAATIEVHSTVALDALEIRQVHVFAGSQVAHVSYAAFVPQPPGAADPGAYVPYEGRYQGAAQLVDLGQRLAPQGPISVETPGEKPPASFSLPLRAELSPFVSSESGAPQYLLVIHDDLKMLSPDGTLVFGLRGSPDSYELMSHVRTYLDLSVDSAADPLGYDLEYGVVRSRFQFMRKNDDGSTYWGVGPEVRGASDRRVGFELIEQFDVLDRPQKAPKMRFRVSLSRAGDLPAGYVAPPFEVQTQFGDVPALPLERFLKPTIWEDRLAQTLASARALDAARTLEGIAPSLAACKPLDTYARRVEFNAASYAASWAHSPAVVMPGEQDNPYLRLSESNAAVTDRLDPLWFRVGQSIVANYGVPLADQRMTGSMDVVLRPRIADVDSPLDSNNPNLSLLELPCAADFDAFTYNLLGVEKPVPAFSDDRCAALSLAYGCEPRTLSAAERTEPSARITHYLTNMAIGNASGGTPSPLYFGGSGSGALDAHVTSVCRMPTVPIACTELAWCQVPTIVDPLASSRLTNDFFTGSGDARCADTARSAGVEADLNVAGLKDLPMLEACLGDLGKLSSPLAGSTAPAVAFDSAGCASVARMITAASASAEVLREQAALPAGQEWTMPQVDDAGRLAHRAFGRWVQLHGFVAKETAQLDDVAAIVHRDLTNGGEVPPDVEAALAVSLRGWDLLLNPRFAVAIDRIPGPVLAKPDYRAAFDLLGNIPHNAPAEPSRALSELMLRTLASQLELLDHAVQKAQLTGRTTILERVGEVLRYVSVVEPMALELHARAVDACVADVLLCGVSGQPYWEDRYQAAATEFSTVLDRVVAHSVRLLRGENMFGIADSDVPLYFAGGQVSDDARFFAISDYLVGSSPGDYTAWAPSLVADAQSRIDAARAAWRERKDREVATDQNEQSRQIRMEDILSTAGNSVLQLCGRPGTLLPGDVLAGWSNAQGRPFAPSDCYVDVQDPACTKDVGAYLNLVSDDDVHFSLCKAQSLNRATPGVATWLNDPMDVFVASCPFFGVELDRAGCTETGGSPCFRCPGVSSVAPVAIPAGMFLNYNLREFADVGAIARAERECRELFPDAHKPLPSTKDLGADPPDRCYRGAIGEQALALQSIAKEVDIARAELDDMTEAYDIAIKTCLLQDELADTLATLQADHESQMHTLRTVKLAADIASNAAGAVKDCATSMAGAALPWDKGCAAGACGSAAVEAVADSVSDGMQYAMDEAEAEHDRQVAAAQADADYAICLNDASQYLTATNTQTLRIEQAMIDLKAATVAFHNLQAQAQLAFDDGLSSYESEGQRTLSPLTDDLWLDEKVDGYLRSFRLSKRVTYLAVRAVEYELQVSLPVRGTVLSAEVPGDLDNALRELRTYTGTRSLGGSRPTNKKAVISLKEQLLKLVDRDLDLEGSLTLSATDRLRLILTAPRFSVFDDAGRYLGQRIPFRLDPQGLTGGEGVELYSQDSCAERLWSVNASVLGTDVLRGSGSTFVDLVVQKANTFSSQRCAVPGELQLASVRPERNLFRDPEAGSVAFAEIQLGRPTDTLYSKALIQASVNVPRSLFEQDAYENGDSSQLAARGLFGEYALFFPAQVLSKAGADGTPGGGLDLTHVDDVLVRFDYLTVAR